jgi:phosphoribosylglycinamide formyltransferase
VSPVHAAKAKVHEAIKAIKPSTIYNKSFQLTLFQNLSTQHTEGLTPDDLVAELQAAGVEYVLLAGYLRLIPPQLCRAYEDKMLNVHPALLPAFGGKGMHGHHVHEAVVASGARFSGPTVHFVNEEFDKGKIVAQRHVDVKPGMDADDVAASVLAEVSLF